MQVFVYHAVADKANNTDCEIHLFSGGKAPLYDGQLFLRMESSLLYYTYDRTAKAWARIVTINNASFSDTVGISVWRGTALGSDTSEMIYKLSYHNCQNWNQCTTDGKWGSRYSVRSDVKVYDGNGSLQRTLPAGAKVDFLSANTSTVDNDKLPASPTAVGIQCSGFTLAGQATTYYGTNVRYASVNFTVHPLNYGINTA